MFAFAQTATGITLIKPPDSIKTFSSEIADSQSDFMNVFVVPEKELIVIQIKNLNTSDLEIKLFDASGDELKKTFLYKASTIAFFDTQTLYNGDYLIKISDGISSLEKKIMLNK